MATSPKALYRAIADDLHHLFPDATSRDLRDPDWASQDFWPDITGDQVKALMLLRSLFKKLEPDENSPEKLEGDRLALNKFLAANDHCRDFKWRPDSMMSMHEIVLNGMIEDMESLFYPRNRFDCSMNLRSIADSFNTGPGANVGVSDRTDFFSKVSMSDLTTTSPWLWRLYHTALEGLNNPRWINAELERHQNVGPPRHVEHSTLSFVPKTVKISRTICTEPVLNGIFQQGISGVLLDILKYDLGIDLVDQQARNRRLARRGSSSGEFCTLDLESASDTISIELCRKLFPPEVFSWFMLTRSAVTKLPDGTLVPLHMISSMGNAFTFPLQTLIFSVCVKNVYKVMGIPIRYNSGSEDGNWGVNGDDIIVDSRAYRFTVDILNLLGFKVNTEKSFSEGNFRESCGGDYWSGQTVRGVYCKKLQTRQQHFTLFNRLLIWSARSGIKLPRALALVKSGVRKRNRLKIPFWENLDAGFFTPMALLDSVTVDRNGSIWYRFDSPRSRRWDPSHLQDTHYNGMLLAFLRGSVANGYIGIRSSRSEYRERTNVAPCWDYAPPEAPHFCDVDVGKLLMVYPS